MRTQVFAFVCGVEATEHCVSLLINGNSLENGKNRKMVERLRIT